MEIDRRVLVMVSFVSWTVFPYFLDQDHGDGGDNIMNNGLEKAIMVP